MVLVWLKNLSYLHAQTAHDATLESDEEGVSARYKASFQIYRRSSVALDQQAQVVFRFLSVCSVNHTPHDRAVFSPKILTSLTHAHAPRPYS